MEVRGEVTEIEIVTHLTSGVFLSLLRNSLPMGIFIVRTDYFTNVFNLIQKKKTAVTNTSKEKKSSGKKKMFSSFFSFQNYGFCSVPPAIHLKNN